jgi:hypothetical protein
MAIINIPLMLVTLHHRSFIIWVGIETSWGVLEARQIRKKGYFWKKDMHEENDNWKEEKHVRMHGRPNDIRVRVFVIHCNGR